MTPSRREKYGILCKSLLDFSLGFYFGWNVFPDPTVTNRRTVEYLEILISFHVCNLVFYSRWKLSKGCSMTMKNISAFSWLPLYVYLFILPSLLSLLATPIVTLSPNLSCWTSLSLFLFFPFIVLFTLREQHLVWNANGRTTTLWTIVLLEAEVIVGNVLSKWNVNHDKNYVKVKESHINIYTYIIYYTRNKIFSFKLLKSMLLKQMLKQVIFNKIHPTTLAKS